ncbi:NUDIX domain-containing protein [Candidatus Micrarchaeota archaeon]|jgi:ADP-ribose pyrophosphatase YjhB (NUDIX family)|nr:NUDIX domain-containing protein [Candidatus Micrarchaeota archaeon]
MAKEKFIEYQGEQIHVSVGAVIIVDNKILMIDRVNFPLGWACPAGHVDEGETVEQALVREVREETGFNVTFAKEIYTEFTSWNECNRGVKGHFWHIFLCTGEGKITTSKKEVKDWGWKKLDEIEEILKSEKMEEVWVFWFKKFKKDKLFDFIG